MTKNLIFVGTSTNYFIILSDNGPFVTISPTFEFESVNFNKTFMNTELYK